MRVVRWRRRKKCCSYLGDLLQEDDNNTLNVNQALVVQSDQALIHVKVIGLLTMGPLSNLKLFHEYKLMSGKESFCG